MPRRRKGLAAELEASGFWSRTRSALIYGLGLRSLDDLRTAPWGSRKERSGLAWELGVLPNFGQRCLAEVEAFCAGRDPRLARPAGRQTVAVSLEARDWDMLDAWIAQQPEPRPSRPAAIRAMMQPTFQIMAGDPEV